MYTRDGGALDAQTRTDAQGRFAFVSAVDFTGDWIAQFYTTDADGRKQWSRIALDRWFEPEQRRLDPRETEVHPPLAPADAADVAAERPDTFAWRDTIPRYVASELHEAVVTHRNRYRGFTGNRYTWNGGEEAGMRQCDIFYDITRAVERCKDAGHNPGYIMDFLAYLDNNASVDRNFDPAADAPDRSIDVGVDYGRLIPASAMLGAGYLVLMDDLARSLLSMELPLGVVTSIMGAPFFVYLIIKKKERR